MLKEICGSGSDRTPETEAGGIWGPRKGSSKTGMGKQVPLPTVAHHPLFSWGSGPPPGQGSGRRRPGQSPHPPTSGIRWGAGPRIGRGWFWQGEPGGCPQGGDSWATSWTSGGFQMFTSLKRKQHEQKPEGREMPTVFRTQGRTHLAHLHTWMEGLRAPGPAAPTEPLSPFLWPLICQSMEACLYDSSLENLLSGSGISWAKYKLWRWHKP